MLNNKQKETIGILAVQRAVQVDWACGWQGYAHINDDAIDGIILMHHGQIKPIATGGVVFVQVKCGGDGYRSDQIQHPDHICINLGEKYLNSHKPRWRVVPGPAVLVFVDDTIDKHNPPCWWVDLKDARSYSTTNKGQILVPKAQKFGSHSKGTFHKLCGTAPLDRILPTINLPRAEDMPVYLSKNESLREDAWAYYKSWRVNNGDRLNPALGDILVNRVGWKHITRPGRRSERIIQSWMLLAAAKKILKECSKVDFLRHGHTKKMADGATQVVDYLGLRAIVKFSYRHESVVQVVLKRMRILNAQNGLRERQKIWFYSVYELRRGM